MSNFRSITKGYTTTLLTESMFYIKSPRLFCNGITIAVQAVPNLPYSFWRLIMVKVWLCVLAVGAIAIAADPSASDKASRQFRAKEVLGTKVSLNGNVEAGVIEDLVFDEAGNLDYLIVNNGGKLLTVPFDATKLDLEKKVAVLTIGPDIYRTIPTYTTTTYPSFYTPTYRAEIYKVYGLTPRELRRIERR